MDYISGATLSSAKAQWMETHLPSGPGKALDIGCAAGLYIHWLQEKKWQVDGIDLHPSSQIQGAKILQHNLEEGLPYPDESFDLVLAWDVLEHVRAEPELWGHIQRVLKRGGVLLGSVPHRDDKILQRYNLTYKHHIDRTHQREYDIVDLENSIRQHGLKKIGIELRGPVSPQFISEFISIPSLRPTIRKIVGSMRRIGILHFGNFYADVFFAARKAA